VIFLLMAVCVVCGAVGDVSVTRGMKKVGKVPSFHPVDLCHSAMRTLQNGSIWLGVASKGIAFFSFLALLTRADVSWAAPAVASTYVVDTVAAKYLLRENVNRTRWTGAVFVCLGVALISL
jgi:drug/metabolite transporter (DMT)-like permease